jgi:hypothetical protein
VVVMVAGVAAACLGAQLVRRDDAAHHWCDVRAHAHTHTHTHTHTYIHTHTYTHTYTHTHINTQRHKIAMGRC